MPLTSPFSPHLDPAAVSDLLDRLRSPRWPEPETTDDDSQGVPLAQMRSLVAYWTTAYSFDRLAERIASVPQRLVTIDGLGVHAIHVRSSRPDAVPLLLNHGWPSTCFEFLDAITLLTEPEGGPAFHVVCPSLPGYGFSGKPTGPGWGLPRIAEAWAELMTALGYDRFVAQGGDWGAGVATEIAIRHPERIHGLHLTMPLASTQDGDLDTASAAEVDGAQRQRDYRRWGYAYATTQYTRPQTIGYGLVDSPVALGAWIVEKLRAWSGRDDDGHCLLSLDAQLDVVTLYWLTATGASSARLYREALRMDPSTPVHVPTGCSIFPDEVIRTPRAAVARRFRDLRSWQELSRGGHFAATEVPAIFAAEVQAFVSGLDLR
ncbi:epoxide hydrolase [soil metagenome]